MSPDERLLAIQHKVKTDKALTRKEAAWLLEQFNTQRRGNERCGAKWLEFRQAVDNIEDLIRMNDDLVVRNALSKVVDLLRRVVGPR